MLHNPNLDKTPIRLDDFIDWVRQHPADKTYGWDDDPCLMAQYLEARRQDLPEWRGTEPPMPGWYMPVTFTQPWTFGDALKRAEAIPVA